MKEDPEVAAGSHPLQLQQQMNKIGVLLSLMIQSMKAFCIIQKTKKKSPLSNRKKEEVKSCLKYNQDYLEGHYGICNEHG